MSEYTLDCRRLWLVKTESIAGRTSFDFMVMRTAYDAFKNLRGFPTEIILTPEQFNEYEHEIANFARLMGLDADTTLDKRKTIYGTQIVVKEKD